jgi:predicted Zn-dependent peptidase
LTDLRITQLDSGLTVATEHVPGALSVATGVWVGVGSRDEPAELSGVSHFLEHLLFKGTPTRTSQEISRSVDRVGGDFNAFTAKEYTAYYCRLPARHALFGVELLGDVLIRPALRATDVDSERLVILEELAMDDDSPDDVAHRMFAARYGADRLDEGGWLAALGHVAARPGAEGGLHQRGLAMHAEDQDA